MSWSKEELRGEERLKEIVKCIKDGIAVNRNQLAELFNVSTRTITNCINEIRIRAAENGIDLDIVHDFSQNKYKVEGDVRAFLGKEFSLSAMDAYLILATLTQAREFVPGRINIIEDALLKQLPLEEEKALRSKLPRLDLEDYSYDGVIKDSLEKVVKSLIGKRKLKFQYMRAPDNYYKNYEANPCFLNCYIGLYYLIAYTQEGEFRHFRIDRMRQVVVGEPFLSEEQDFNAMEYLRRCWLMYHGEKTIVKVKFRNQVYKVVTERQLSQGKIVENKKQEGYFIYEFEAYGTEGILIWLMGFGDQAEILEPLELREKAKSIVKNMMKLYSLESWS